MADVNIIGAFKEAMREVVRDEMASRERSSIEGMAEARAHEEIHLWRSYSVKEAAQFLPLTPKAIYDIPESQLKPHRLGASGGRKAFLGINILMYMAGLEPVDVESVAKKVREEFLADAKKPHNVKPIGSGKKRIL